MRSVLVGLCLFWIGCMGDDPSPTNSSGVDDGGPGARGVGKQEGPCYPNATCDPGLQCASGVCRNLTADGPCVMGNAKVGSCSLGK